MNRSVASSQVLTDLAIIVGVWFALIAIFALLGRTGHGTGLAIGTIGEDQNWIALLQGETSHAIANNFWKIDGRNPLSPWLYIISRPLILFVKNGIALLQYVVGLSLALAAYGLLRLLAGSNGRWFALSTSTIIAVNQSNAYFDHIIWNFQVALCCTIMSIFSYILFLRSERQWILAYGVSLSFWCVAFHIYTLQSGAIAAIAICQLAYLSKAMGTKRNATPEVLSVQALKHGVVVVLDLIPYVTTFAIFLLTWTTVTGPGNGFPYQFSFERFLSSLQTGFFHQDTALMLEVLRLSTFTAQYVTVSILFAFAVTYLVALIAPEVPRGQMVARYLIIMLIVISIALPTILLESGGIEWSPGSRWRMIYQVTTPILIMSIAGSSLSVFRSRYSSFLFRIFSGVLLAASLAFSLAYNERQVSLTKSEAAVRQAMRDAIVERRVEGSTNPLFFILEMDDSFQWLATEALRSVYMKTWFPGINVEYRILPSPRYSPSNPTKLKFNQRGIDTVMGGSVEIPYDQVVLLRASGKSVQRHFSISREEVVTHNGDWMVSEDRVELR